MGSVRTRMHRALGRGQRERGSRRQQLCPALRRRGQVVGLDHLGDQPEREGALGIDRIAGEQQLGRASVADQPGQSLGPAPARDDPELDLGLTEARGARREPDVARERELASAAERDAVDCRDHREPRRLDRQR